MHYSELNYDSYDKYLQGPEWQEIHDIFFDRGGKYQCKICHSKEKLILHKRTYYSLRPEFFKDMDDKWLRKFFVWLCIKHNTEIHFYNKEEKVPLDHLFLSERENEIYKRPLNRFRRVLRDSVAFSRIFKVKRTRKYRMA